VLITGGSRGLGFAAARCFLEEGADVAICARDQGELRRAELELRDVAERVGRRMDAPPRIVTVSADVTDEHATARLVSEVIALFGRLDVLVNAAVEIAVGPLEALNAADFEQAFRGIFFTAYHPTMAVLPHMRAQRFGRIVNVASIAGKLPISHNASYTAGKFALTGFSLVSAVELRKYGIRVSTVLPPPLRNGAWMNAGYKGRADEELSWFAGALESPLLSADPARAARAIVKAARYGDVELMVTPISWVQSRLQSLWPSALVALQAWVDAHFMPATPPGARELAAQSGEEIVTTSTNPRVQELARRARGHAERHLQPVAAKIT
jgi:NAD(P)-dependent dehydrogenase (short-subunit alcohol dehydrogenase family)